MNSTRLIRRWVRVVTLVFGLAAILATAPHAAQTSPPLLRHLGGVEELKTWFNAGQGRPRLIFLLSPT